MDDAIFVAGAINARFCGLLWPEGLQVGMLGFNMYC